MTESASLFNQSINSNEMRIGAVDVGFLISEKIGDAQKLF